MKTFEKEQEDDDEEDDEEEQRITHSVDSSTDPPTFDWVEFSSSEGAFYRWRLFNGIRSYDHTAENHKRQR